jgi:large subunit ribosomal protein L4
MAKAVAYSKTGSKQAESVTLDKAVFDVTPNHELLGLAYRSYLANGRSAGAKTLTRGEVRGGGRKPWRQKGTGRARAGSIRIPHWKGGGVVFGPTGLENYEIKLPLKMKRAAIRQALSAQAKDGKLVVLEAMTSADGKTKATREFINKLGLEGSLLLVVDNFEALLDRATRNLSGLETVEAKYLNVFTILNADHIIITKPALAVINDWLGGKA